MNETDLQLYDQLVDIFAQNHSRFEQANEVLALISRTVSSVIGEDEEKKYVNAQVDLAHERRNKLRAEQRATAKRLLGSDV